MKILKCSAIGSIAHGHHGQQSNCNVCIAGAATERWPTEPANFAQQGWASLLKSKKIETCTDIQAQACQKRSSQSRRFESATGAYRKGDDVVKWYLVTVRIDGTITNKLIRAASPDEAEKEALRCASQETTD